MSDPRSPGPVRSPRRLGGDVRGGDLPSADGRIRTLTAGLAILLLVTIALLPGPRASAQGLTLRSLGGDSFSEGEMSRGPTIVVVWASWSPRGRDVVSRVNALHRRWSSKCRVLTVNFQEDRQTIQEFLATQNLQVPVLLDEDGAFAKKYAVTSLPGLLVFRDGQKAFGGRLPDDPDRVLGEIFP